MRRTKAADLPTLMARYERLSKQRKHAAAARVHVAMVAARNEQLAREIRAGKKERA